MAYVNEYGSGINLDALMVPTQAATVFAAQENSLYLPGLIIPSVSVAAGSASAQVAVMGSVDATVVTNNGDGTQEIEADFASSLPTNTKKPINLDLIAARTVLRDLGGIDPAEMGRVMGNAIAAEIDKQCSVAIGTGLGTAVVPTSNLLNDLYDAIGTIRAAGETGALNCIVAATSYKGFMQHIGSSAFAGGETQNAAMRTGFIGMIAGVPCYVSSHFNATNTGLTTPDFAVFSQDALRMAMQGGVNLEVERRAAAVGNDIVASAAFGVAALDATRGVVVGTA